MVNSLIYQIGSTLVVIITKEKYMDAIKEVVKVGKGAVATTTLSIVLSLALALAARKMAYAGKFGVNVQNFVVKYL